MCFFYEATEGAFCTRVHFGSAAPIRGNQLIPLGFKVFGKANIMFYWMVVDEEPRKLPNVVPHNARLPTTRTQKWRSCGLHVPRELPKTAWIFPLWIFPVFKSTAFPGSESQNVIPKNRWCPFASMSSWAHFFHKSPLITILHVIWVCKSGKIHWNLALQTATWPLFAHECGANPVWRKNYVP